MWNPAVLPLTAPLVSVSGPSSFQMPPPTTTLPFWTVTPEYRLLRPHHRGRSRRHRRVAAGEGGGC